MMTRIRPVLASQLAWPGLSLHQGGVLLQGYYNNAARTAEAFLLDADGRR